MQEMTLAEEANPLFMFVVLLRGGPQSDGPGRWASGAGGVFGG